MAYNNGTRAPRISTDRFGNPYQLKFAAQVTNRKTGEEVNAFKTYVELGGKLYKIEVSQAEKTKEIKGQETAGMWVKVTHVKKQAAASM